MPSINSVAVEINSIGLWVASGGVLILFGWILSGIWARNVHGTWQP